jgi:putative ABC transport system permease protein
MILGENVRESIRSLWGAKQRSILALIGIVIGIGSVIAMVTVGQIVENEAIRQFKEMGTDICIVRLSGITSGQKQNKSLNLEDIKAVPEHCSTIRVVAPYVSTYSTLTFAGVRKSCPALGVTEEFRNMFKVPLVAGRFISDLDRHANFCVLGSSKAKWLAEQGITEPVGEKIVFGERMYTVIGVAQAVPTGTFSPYEINEGIMLPISTVLRSPERPALSVFGARMTGHGVSVQAAEQLQNYFKYTSKQKTRITSAEELVAQMDRQMRMFTLLLGAIGSISLIVGGVGVMNVMLVSVSERRGEIGIRRAVGAEQNDIQLQFLVESVILSFVGGIIGLGVGGGATAIICHFKAARENSRLSAI